ncbi:myosin-4-like [Salvia hispanica]|uniref:myosin-4-like n=1 Tax=Salvia hispanica TaxID=49212 RepID=UPI0020098DF2|nr:myosin-4-like [Salvia hispanica]
MVTTTSMATRSSLELMLDKLQQLEEQPPDTLPPLPARARRARPPRPPGRHSQRNGIAAASHHFLEKKLEFGELKEGAERGVCKIQKCYRGYRVRCCYWELKRGVIALQSFIRGQNARRGYEQRCRILSAIITIQKQGRKYLELRSASLNPNQMKRRQLEAEKTKDQTRIPHTSLVDLQKRVVRTEAKLRAKNEENAALKRRLLEIEKKWQQREERMASMEKEWQDQLTYIQECLAATAKKNQSPQIRFSNRFQNPENGRGLHIPMKSNNNEVDEDDEVGEERVCLKVRPREELQKLSVRFKEWKKEYKNKLRNAQSTFKKTSKSHKNWWGRLSN